MDQYGRGAAGGAVAGGAERRGAGATGRAAATTAPPAKTPAKAWKRQRRVASAAVAAVLAWRPPHGGHCGQALPAAGGTVVGRNQVVELPPVRPLVAAAQRWHRRGRQGQHLPVGPYPAAFGATGQFGPRLVATAAYLHEAQHLG